MSRQEVESAISEIFGNDAAQMSPRSPRASLEGPALSARRGLGRGRSEGHLHDRCELSPRDALPRSPRRALAEIRGRHLNAGLGGGPPEPTRSPSPTFRVSENWMSYSAAPPDTAGAKSPRRGLSPRAGGRTMVEAWAEKPPAPEARPPMPRPPIRGHCGRTTETSVKWVGVAEDAPPGPSLIANSENFVASRGKKVNIVEVADNVGNRLRQDASDPEATRSQRRHGFPSNPQSQRQIEQMRQVAPRILQRMAPEAAGRFSGRAPVLVDAQHRSSAELVASLMPEAPEVRGSRSEVRYFAGSEIVGSGNGRRIAGACARQAPELAGRDHRNSDALREHLQHLQPRLSEPMPRSPASATPSSAAVREAHGVFSYGVMSSLPSTMPKDSAYTHSGLAVVKYGSRTPGVFSPNVVRVPAASVLTR